MEAVQQEGKPDKIETSSSFKDARKFDLCALGIFGNGAVLNPSLTSSRGVFGPGILDADHQHLCFFQARVQQWRTEDRYFEAAGYTAKTLLVGQGRACLLRAGLSEKPDQDELGAEPS